MLDICYSEIILKFGANRVRIGDVINFLVLQPHISQPKSPPSTRHTVTNTYPRFLNKVDIPIGLNE